jgi:hypothetical protein
MKRLPWFEIILILVVISISLYGAFSDGQNFSRRWFVRDDAYYYFKVAQNISEGHGSTFDGINRTNGYHPLWMLICIPIFALARIDLILPLRILFLLMSGLSVATAILLYRLIGKVFTPIIGAIAALYWVFSPDILNRVYKQGLETGIAAFFIVLFLYKLYEFERSWREKTVTKKDLIVLGVIAALVIFSRLDLVFLVAIAGLWVVFRGSALRYLLALDIVSLSFSVLLAFVIKAAFPDYYKLSNVAVTMLGVSLLIKIPLAYLFGLYQRGKIENMPGFFRSLTSFVIASSAFSGIIMMIVSRVLAFDTFPRIVILFDATVTFFLFGLTRLILIGLKTFEPISPESESPFAHFRKNWRRWINEGLIYYGVSFGALGIYMLWSKFVFGTFSPVSGQVKRWWGSLTGRVYGGVARNVQSFFGVSYEGDSNAWHPVSTLFGDWAEKLYKSQILDVWRYVIILTLFALVFYAVLLINKSKAKTAVAHLGIIPLFCGAWLQIFYYHMLGYSAYKEWYWVAQLTLIVIVLSLMIGMLYQLVRKVRVIQSTAWAVVVIFGLYMSSMFWLNMRDTMTYHEWSADDPYMDLAAFLEKHTDPGSMIGMTGGGNAAYFIEDRTIINMDGLINSHAYFELLKKKEAGKYLAEIGMDYILASRDLLNGLPYRGQYEEYTEWMDINYGGKDLVRYHTIQP